MNHVYEHPDWRYNDGVGWYRVDKVFVDWASIERDAWREFCSNPQMKHAGHPETYRGKKIV